MFAMVLIPWVQSQNKHFESEKKSIKQVFCKKGRQKNILIYLEFIADYLGMYNKAVKYFENEECGYLRMACKY